MRVARHLRIGLALFTVSLLAVGGCSDGGTAGKGGPSGTIVVDGSSTVFRISRVAQEAFSQVKPDVTVVVDTHGTGGGFSRYLEGEVDVVDASRAALPDEESRAKAQGIDWTRFLVGYDGITLITNARNDFVKALSVAQLKAIWEPKSKVRTWKDVDPAWPDRKIVLYCPDHDSGTFDFFTEAIVGKTKSQRDDVQGSPDDNTLVNGVAGDEDGLGYLGYAYYSANTEKLHAVAVQKGSDATPVAPSPATILNKSYIPLSRPLYVYVKNSSLRRPEVLAFVKFYLENIESLATKAGYVAPTAPEREANLKALPASTAKHPGEP